MGKSRRQRERPRAPEAEYRGPEGQLLVLRGVLTPATRREYAKALHGNQLSREDAWHRAVEFLFERLTVRWVIADVQTDRQRDLLARFRVASGEELTFIRATLREHLAEHFPDLEAP